MGAQRKQIFDYTLLSKGLNNRFRSNIILAHRLGISEILPWDRKLILPMLFLPRLSREGCTLIVSELTRMVVKSHHCYVKVTSLCGIASQRIQGLLEAYFKIKKTMLSKKNNPLFV